MSVGPVPSLTDLRIVQERGRCLQLEVTDPSSAGPPGESWVSEAWGEVSSSGEGGFALPGAQQDYHDGGGGGVEGGSSSLSQGFTEAPQLAASRGKAAPVRGY